MKSSLLEMNGILAQRRELLIWEAMESQTKFLCLPE